MRKKFLYEDKNITKYKYLVQKQKLDLIKTLIDLKQ